MTNKNSINYINSDSSLTPSRKRLLIGIYFLYLFFFLLAVWHVFNVVVLWKTYNEIIDVKEVLCEDGKGAHFKLKELFLRKQRVEYLKKTNGRGEFRRYKVVCYYTLPQDQNKDGELLPKAIDPYLCSHIIIGFAQVNNNTLEPQNLKDFKVYKAILEIRSINPFLKVLLSIRDSSSNEGLGEVVSSKENRAKFARQAVAFMRANKLDGLDFDWEFPAWPQKRDDQKRNFTLLLKQLCSNMKGHMFGGILTVAVGAPETIIHQSYEIQEMSKYVDFINLMSYDYHMFTNLLPMTGPNSPLYSRPVDSGYLTTLNTNWSAYQWLISGMPKGKIMIGIPTFGHSFTLLNENNCGWNAPAMGVGKTGEGGFTKYAEACNFTSKTTTTHLYDDDYRVPYAYNGREWVSYENLESITAKANYIMENNFGGAMIYSLNYDDFLSECGGQNFALTRKVSDMLTAG